MGLTETRDDRVGIRTEAQLSHLIPALWKATLRAAKGSERLPALESQVSIIRKLVDAGPLAPAQLADELYLARPTISNLLKGLEADGLVRRDPSPSDRRSVVVTPTAYGRDVLEQFRHGRLEVLTEALEALDAEDRAQLEGALPALDRLLERLEEIADAPPPQERKPA